MLRQVTPVFKFEPIRASINSFTDKHGVEVGVPKFYQGEGFYVVTLDVRIAGLHGNSITKRAFSQVVGAAKYNPRDARPHWTDEGYMDAVPQDDAFGQELAFKRAVRTAFDLAKTQRGSAAA